MSVVLFEIVLVASFIIVRIGAVAFQLTGLEWPLAKFQALSCFSGTGFTTKESELITGDPRRRRIASILMVLGNAGLVTMIATVASAMNPENTLLGWLSVSYLSFLPRWSVMWFNLGIIIVAFFAIYKLSTNMKFTQKLTDYLRKKIIKKEFFQTVSFDELLMLTGGYGVTRLEVPGGNPLIDKTLAESELRMNDITVLAIIRDKDTIPNPSANAKIHERDELVLFGKLENIKNKVATV
jgi:hypothetical protein